MVRGLLLGKLMARTPPPDSFERIDAALLARIGGGSVMDRLRQGYAIWKPLSFGFMSVAAPHELPPVIMPTPPAIVRQIGER